MQELRETLAALEDQLALRDEQARRPLARPQHSCCLWNPRGDSATAH